MSGLWNHPHYEMMGILNVTPDSFSDGGCFNHPHRFYERARQLLNLGVKVLDVGAESSAPASTPICAVEEKKRLTPFQEVLLQLDREFSFLLSLDTYHPETAFSFFENLLSKKGPERFLWNDVSGRVDDHVFSFLKTFPKAEYVFTHNLAPSRPLTSFHRDYVREEGAGIQMVLKTWNEAYHIFQRHGLEHRIWWDPGFGFAKTFRQNEELLHFFAEKDKVQEFLFPKFEKLLLGISRKSFLRQRLAREKTEESFLASERLHREWLLKWKDALCASEGRKVLIRLHSPLFECDAR